MANSSLETTSFIGVDLAWRSDGNHSGIAVLIGNDQQVRLTAIADGVTSMAGVVEFIASHATLNSVIAVDASLVVRNQTGQRPCETLIAKQFGKYHASCHTTNLKRAYARAGMNLVAALEKHRFVHDFDITTTKQRRGRWLFEVYPHPAMIRVFELDRIIPYKKGTVAQRRRGLDILRHHLGNLASGPTGLMASPMFRELLEWNLKAVRGEKLKRYEDTLDAIFCAYLAWHCWRWGEERNKIFGTLTEGYIVVPKVLAEVSK